MQIFSKKKKSIHAEVFGIFALLQEKIRKYETLKSSEKAVIVLSISEIKYCFLFHKKKNFELYIYLENGILNVDF